MSDERDSKPAGPIGFVCRAFSTMDRHERRWLIANSVVWVAVSLALFEWERGGRFSGGTAEINLDLLACGIRGVFVEMFVIGIPTRLAINLVVPERRRQCRAETFVLLLTFAALCCMAAAIVAYRRSGLDAG